MAAFSYTLPVIGGSEDQWGADLNANWTALGSFLGTLDSAELAVLDGITATTAEMNHSAGVTSPIQAQIDARATSADPSLTGTIGLGANWTVRQSGTELRFAYDGTDRMKIDESGNLTVGGNVTAYGAV